MKPYRWEVWTVISMVHAIAPFALGAQSVDMPRLSPSGRGALVGSVIRDREEYFGQIAIVDGCTLATVLGDSSRDSRAELPPALQARVRGRPGACDWWKQEKPAGRAIILKFDRIRYEMNEYIPGREESGARPTGLLLVDVIVTVVNVGTHIEQWVMREARPGIWAVMTMRAYGFGAG